MCVKVGPRGEFGEVGRWEGERSCRGGLDSHSKGDPMGGCLEPGAEKSHSSSLIGGRGKLAANTRAADLQGLAFATFAFLILPVRSGLPGNKGMPAPLRARVVILTCSVVAIAGIGGWYGADLKISQQARKVSLCIIPSGRQSRDLQKPKLTTLVYRRYN